MLKQWNANSVLTVSVAFKQSANPQRAFVVQTYFDFKSVTYVVWRRLMKMQVAGWHVESITKTETIKVGSLMNVNFDKSKLTFRSDKGWQMQPYWGKLFLDLLQSQACLGVRSCHKASYMSFFFSVIMNIKAICYSKSNETRTMLFIYLFIYSKTLRFWFSADLRTMLYEPNVNEILTLTHSQIVHMKLVKDFALALLKVDLWLKWMN